MFFEKNPSLGGLLLLLFPDGAGKPVDGEWPAFEPYGECGGISKLKALRSPSSSGELGGVGGRFLKKI